MGPVSCAELDPRLQQSLIDLARRSIHHGLEQGRALPVDLETWPEVLRVPAATFVTLKREGRLRGCIGSLEARQPLVRDVADHAFAAAFRDPRFPPLEPGEFDDLDISISILGEPEPLHVESEAELLAKLRPGVDGLILEEGWRRATFLPSVWESLPEPRDFLVNLKLKAGIAPEHWSDDMRCSRYEVREIGEH